MDFFLDLNKLYKRIFKGEKYAMEKVFEDKPIESLKQSAPEKGQNWSLGKGHSYKKVLSNIDGKVTYYTKNKDTVLTMDESNFINFYTKC
jgi:hypothetical protein